MCDPCSLPRCGGGARAPVRDGGGMGGGREGPPVRGPAGPRLPLLLASSPPRQGRGLLPVRKAAQGGGGGREYVWSIPLRPGSPVFGRRGPRCGPL